MRPCWNFVHYAIWKPLPTSQSCCIKNLYNMFTQKSCILSFSPKDNNGILTNSVTWVASYLNGKKKKNQIIEIELDEISHTINTYIHTYLCIYVYIYMQQKRINDTNFILSFLETSLPCPGSNVILPWARQVRFLHYEYIKNKY